MQRFIRGVEGKRKGPASLASEKAGSTVSLPELTVFRWPLVEGKGESPVVRTVEPKETRCLYQDQVDRWPSVVRHAR